MIKKVFAVFMFVVSINSFATCPHALPTNDAGFCPSFKAAAICYCTSSGMPSGWCQDINAVYNRMISLFGTQQKACEYQRVTSVQECMDGWNCYLRGGIDSQGRACSSTRLSCQ